jgi:integrase/recombinase XerD
MKALKDPKLFNFIREYTEEYLPKQHRCRPNTIRAYKNGIDALFDYIKEKNNIRLVDVTFDMINRKTVAEFIEWLENEQKSSISTRNLRLAAIRTFVSFAADCDSALVHKAAEVSKVKTITRNATHIVKYLSEPAIKAVLNEPDGKTKLGMRDRLILVMLYDTAGRIQEVLDIKLKDLRLIGKPIVTLLGKSGMPRNVSLMDTTVKHIRQYLKTFHPNTALYADEYLFYTKHRIGNSRMTEDNARKRIKEYGNSAREKCSEMPENLHPHLLRHSRAMHLYQRGMPLALVSQLLGHTEVETTEIYAHADTEMKRKAIEAATPHDSPLREFVNSERYTMSDEDTIKRLYGIK